MRPTPGSGKYLPLWATLPAGAQAKRLGACGCSYHLTVVQIYETRRNVALVYLRNEQKARASDALNTCCLFPPKAQRVTGEWVTSIGEGFWLSLVILTSHFEATHGLFWDEHHNFEMRSDDEDDTWESTPTSPSFHTITAGRCLALEERGKHKNELESLMNERLEKPLGCNSFQH
ncbi:hypothetical protein AVEN_253906-1 [Araneus ventricosus]|uniref:Uncharacterized protein n=1 Tax=Araneus ventricosus TaxID=182803 RepID=A0A4Y2ENI1_ARAVE|nr:hypothetical protein AVEN_253906-1 [Araneus ventricosus]